MTLSRIKELRTAFGSDGQNAYWHVLTNFDVQDLLTTVERQLGSMTPEQQCESDTVRRCLEIIAERRFAYYERHDEKGWYSCSALDGASHEIAKHYGMLANEPEQPCPCPCHIGQQCLRYPTCCGIPGARR